MQWDGSPHAGFANGEPWVPVNPNAAEINVEAAMTDHASVLHHYRKLIAPRHELPVVALGDFTMVLEQDPRVYAFARSTASRSSSSATSRVRRPPSTCPTRPSGPHPISCSGTTRRRKNKRRRSCRGPGKRESTGAARERPEQSTSCEHGSVDPLPVATSPRRVRSRQCGNAYFYP